MKKRIAVLGCGRIGATIARDLAGDNDLEVCVFDASEKNLSSVRALAAVRTETADLADIPALTARLAPFDAVAGALPSRLGFDALKAIAGLGKPCADISFMIEDPRQFDDIARSSGATIVYDCGVAPGLANICIGRSHAELDALDDVVYYVGGLPWRRQWPLDYKAPFAPSDVIEEYTRPARMIEHGAAVVKPALTEPELLDFPQIGTLEGFNTDGLRSLLDTIPARNMREKTLRYPGHCALMRAFRETGLFDTSPMRVGDVDIRPIDMTSKILADKWLLEADEPEFTVLRVIVEGTRGGRRKRHTYDLFDERDAATGMSSMARTTAFPCTIVARMLAHGQLSAPGVHPPEWIGGQSQAYETLIEELSRRNVHVARTQTDL
ncbi:MAG: saccharopine dehydrogenase NADP-binding domain-containing protein [Phycisphaerales bacterium]|nr:saccharopine dehydrogenase NADP-binding domain-containing protein [Phycisphaerales bacterium]